ncbi:hypothetical protein OHA71_03785 [Streptomyces sp. NBC_00444]|uniref:hypothetical protein n=1 Tax=Streptomyces sp. NBC_00444 TaxID=2975744 RepID=UPI002E1CB6FE
MPTARTLASAVFVTDPKTRETLLLQPGTEISDPVIAEQITHTAAWVAEPPPPSRRTKANSS